MKTKFNKKTKLRFKIFLGVILSFLMVNYFSPKIFLADSPKVNPEFIAAISNSPLSVVAYLGNLQEGASLSDYVETAKMPKAFPPKGLSYTPIAQGVYAAEDPTTGERYAKVDKGTKLEKITTINSDGTATVVYRVAR